MGLIPEVLEDPDPDPWFKERLTSLVNGGSLQGYLFRCLHWGRHLPHIDCD